MRVEECFDRRLLRREIIEPGRWERSLEISAMKRDRASSLFKDGYYEESIFQAYTSMFHAARAILFRDGIVEKSHICVISYLDENYSSIIGSDLIGWLDDYRIERHEVIYGMDQIMKIEDEARLAYDRCKLFYETVHHLLMVNITRS